MPTSTLPAVIAPRPRPPLARRPALPRGRPHAPYRANAQGDDGAGPAATPSDLSNHNNNAAAPPQPAAPGPARGVDPVFGLAPSDLPPSIWALKPPWCQPWTILATGGLAVAVASTINPWLGGGAAVGVAGWWWLFLVQVPASYAEYVRAAQQGRGQDEA